MLQDNIKVKTKKDNLYKDRRQQQTRKNLKLERRLKDIRDQIIEKEKVRKHCEHHLSQMVSE